jgi:hypothetical protein
MCTYVERRHYGWSMGLSKGSKKSGENYPGFLGKHGAKDVTTERIIERGINIKEGLRKMSAQSFLH